ncbi:uncharacterized protein BT62DRAFT_934283 [Guyanagaster necrorhizus]|uniref:Uncharacterized protein n=1 Tax=Guyanagaster necrorhizus TaxID=856835 RepID=A0A9P7VP45_9AGAR|nr:uncharacterized protein BT62DRAFT_934283 [Guyanagaster necrorhizus MCA 3950]KAG7444113.1 hypothetical protein BT62DRAFT_934283 [Guyanagaster necrorhizus MCA 3950]
MTTEASSRCVYNPTLPVLSSVVPLSPCRWLFDLFHEFSRYTTWRGSFRRLAKVFLRVAVFP